MMTSCTECAIKHLSTAAAYIREANNGYPDYRLWAIGELVQAEFELMDVYPDQSQRVRAERLLWRNSRRGPKEYNIPFMEIMKTLQDISDAEVIVDIPAQPAQEFLPPATLEAIDEMFKDSERIISVAHPEMQKMYDEMQAGQPLAAPSAVDDPQLLEQMHDQYHRLKTRELLSPGATAEQIRLAEKLDDAHDLAQRAIASKAGGPALSKLDGDRLEQLVAGTTERDRVRRLGIEGANPS